MEHFRNIQNDIGPYIIPLIEYIENLKEGNFNQDFPVKNPSEIYVKLIKYASIPFIYFEKIILNIITVNCIFDIIKEKTGNESKPLDVFLRKFHINQLTYTAKPR